MPGDELQLQRRASVFGDYGRFVNELYVRGDFKDWESAQVYATTHYNREAPPGYDAIRNKTCYVSVFETAWQACYIDSARLSVLKAEARRQNPLGRYILMGGLSYDAFVKERFRPNPNPGLYWLFRRGSDGERDVFRPVAHLMYSLDGVHSAGSNNYAKNMYPYINFATIDMNDSDFQWLPDRQCWTRTDDPLLLDIYWTPLSALQSS
jgi:hypothetical protein